MSVRQSFCLLPEDGEGSHVTTAQMPLVSQRSHGDPLWPTTWTSSNLFIWVPPPYPYHMGTPYPCYTASPSPCSYITRISIGKLVVRLRLKGFLVWVEFEVLILFSLWRFVGRYSSRHFVPVFGSLELAKGRLCSDDLSVVFRGHLLSWL